MFANLRYLAIACFLLMAIGGAYLTMLAREYQQNELMQTAHEDAQSTIASFSSALWSRYAPEIAHNASSPYLPSFVQETTQFFAKQRFVKVTIFSPDMTMLYYGTGDQYVTTDGSVRVTLFGIDTALKGKPISRTLKKVFLTGSRDAQKPRMLVQSIIPLLRNGTGAPEALAEIYTDVTADTDSITNKVAWVLCGIMGVFTLLIVSLLITARRAEGIITKQHEVNIELIAAAAQAEAQSRDKSQFLASVSHELRTPLNAIIGFSDIIRNEAKEMMQKVHQDYLDDIHASGKHLLSLINDILDYSKAEAGKLQVEWAETDATKIIRNSLRMVMPRAETAQVTLVEDIPNQHLVIVTDAKKLKQVLLNLLSNAVKFTRPGGEVRCHVWVEVATGHLHIEVKDTGIGIAPKDISRVMTPFGQVDSALSRKYEGTGLGLPLSKKFVESMGGTFTIESELDVGTTVAISVPKAPPGWGTAAMNETQTLTEDSHVASDTNAAA